jgi:hypothetical protein
LPEVRRTFFEGRLSFDAVRAVTRFATPDSDDVVAAEAPQHTVATLRRIAARASKVTDEEARAELSQRYLRVRWDREGRVLHLNGVLPAADGAIVDRALERIAESRGPDPTNGIWPPFEVQAADALVELAGARLGRVADPDRATVVVHVDAGALRGEPGRCELEAGVAVATSTVERLLCDGRVQWVAEAADGTPLGVGRTRRTVPPWLMRILRERYESCAFTGCTRRRLVQAHHVKEWSKGGRTDLENLIPLCFDHHKMVHEGGWNILHIDGRLRFQRPDGTLLATGPPALRDEVRDRMSTIHPAFGGHKDSVSGGRKDSAPGGRKDSSAPDASTPDVRGRSLNSAPGKPPPPPTSGADPPDTS